MDRRPERRSTVWLAVTPATARVARRFAVEATAADGHADLADDVALLTGELIANAIRHAVAPIGLTVETSPDTVRLEVHDAGTDAPVLGALPPDAGHGLGLHIVERLASAWGADRLADNGKVVWVELRETYGG